ncbi:MAG: GMP synthase subunit A [Candidatus Altiarchaeota archaeon]
MIIVVDYGGQYVHRIWRSLKYLGVESKVVGRDTPIEEMMSMNPEGFIMSGGPSSVYEDSDKLGDYKGILDSGLPVLGICLGHQIMAHALGGVVRKGESGEYAAVDIRVLEEDDLFKGLESTLTVWESHRDEVVELPPGFVCLAESDICSIEAMKHESKRLYAVQFHPEVNHTPHGAEILKNYMRVCGL